MESSVSLKDEIWFLRVCHHISTGFYSYFPPTWPDRQALGPDRFIPEEEHQYTLNGRIVWSPERFGEGKRKRKGRQIKHKVNT